MCRFKLHVIIPHAEKTAQFIGPEIKEETSNIDIYRVCITYKAFKLRRHLEVALKWLDGMSPVIECLNRGEPISEEIMTMIAQASARRNALVRASVLLVTIFVAAVVWSVLTYTSA
jgi:hypothetical protein